MKKNKKSLSICLFLFSIYTPSTFAFESFPEFQSLTEREQEEFETPDRLENEYSSHVLSYMKPIDWQYEWLNRNIALDGVIGSVSARHFLLDNRLIFRKFLTDHLEFRFTYFDDRNRDRELVHHIFELVVWLFDKKLGLSAYGEPTLFKRNTDTGLAIMYKPQPRHEIRLFNTFVDVTRLKRNDRSDTYIEPDLPYSRGIVGRIWSHPKTQTKDFFEYAFRYESKTRWNFPDELYEYQYWKLYFSLFGSKAIRPGFRIQSRIQFDRKFETRFPTDSSSTQTDEAWRTDRLLSFLGVVIDHFGPKQNWQFSPGIQFIHRQWNTQAGKVSQHQWLPHVSMRFPAFGSGPTQDFWKVGYVMTAHQSEGPLGLRNPNDPDQSYEHRLNLTYEFSFKDSSSIVLIATADLDEFGSRKTWEGGSGQFRFYF